MTEKEILAKAIDIADPMERAAFLERECADQRDVRERIDLLLEKHFRTESESDLGASDATLSYSTNTSLAGSIVAGRYKLLEEIGEGGMGAVWMAEQREPVKRLVAIKLIKAGMDSKAVLARFEAERQALALMDHLSIAKILDGGTTDDRRPYFVMELVKGLALTEYCDSRRLSVRDRLALFAQVCNAVQHAHQKGVIHRDLKPTNILVTEHDGRPVPKVIDFGLAKALNAAGTLTDKTLHTTFGSAVGTPLYMAPEQVGVNSFDVDTRTDIYALGVILYELLTGTTPLERKRLQEAAWDEMRRLIRELEPIRPSARLSSSHSLPSVAACRQIEPKQLTGLVRGELDWIVMKALEKDRNRRYESANGFAMDIQRYLANEAVLAAPPSNAYRFRKFVRRNRAKVVAGGVIAAALSLGMIGTGLALQRALRAESQLRSQLTETEKAQKAEKARADELTKVSDFHTAMLDQLDVTAAGERLTEDVNRRFLEALERANVPAAERAAKADEFRAQWEQVNATDTARSLIDESIIKPAIRAIDEQFQDQPLIDAALRKSLGEVYYDLALYDAAYPLLKKALDTRQRELPGDHPNVIFALYAVGVLLFDQNKFDDAEPYYREALEKSRRINGNDDKSTLDLISDLGLLLKKSGRLEEAEPFYREAIERKRRVLGEEHPETISSINNQAFLLLEQRKYDQAEPLFREALAKNRRVRGEKDPLTVNSISALGSLFYDQAKYSEAEPYFREALEKRRRLLGEEHPDTVASYGNFGSALLRQRKIVEAEPFLREAMEASRRILGQDAVNTLSFAREFADLLVAQGHHQEAIDLLLPLEVASRKAFSGVNRRLALMLSVLGRANLGMGYSPERFQNAESHLLEAYPILVSTRGEAHWETLVVVQGLCDLYIAWDAADPDKGYDSKATDWKAKLASPSTH